MVLDKQVPKVLLVLLDKLVLDPPVHKATQVLLAAADHKECVDHLVTMVILVQPVLSERKVRKG